MKKLTAFLIVVVIVAAVIGLFLLLYRPACAEDAKYCDDGSSVGRGGPFCQFPACKPARTCANDVDCENNKACWYMNAVNKSICTDTEYVRGIACPQECGKEGTCTYQIEFQPRRYICSR